MDKSLEDMEEQLKDMYKKIRRINILSKGCVRLQKQIDNMHYSIKGFTNNMTGISAINYSADKVQTSKSYHSSLEKKIEESILKCEARVISINEVILENRTEISFLEQDIMELRENVEELEEGSRKFIEFRYRDGKSIYQIADYFKIDENTAYRRRDALLESIIQRTNFKGKKLWDNLGIG